MYLKSIEIQGFKSFAHKIKLDFHNGITGIVGPNGSGKSNIADAVRWVLGEQRIKQLRGGSMQDVIFSGTENRKPLSFASVAITLDNSDHKLPIEYEEVTVTRKLYRSGESDYQLNGHSCRLKDINELFYDTGIGKEGYSIIGQGQIDKILSGKPEERRELFDEAAGIVKFKRRKDASLKKLTDERANLLRVNDILSELEIQVGPLKEQSEKAKEYLTKKEELKRFDINSFLLENERINSQKIQIENSLVISKAEQEETVLKKEDMKIQYQAIEDELEEIEGKVEKAKNQLNETTLLKQQLESQIELIKEQIKSAKQNDEHFDDRKKALDLEISTRETLLKELLLDKADLEEKLSTKKATETAVDRELVIIRNNVVELATKIESSKSEIIELLNNRATTRADIGKFDTLKEQLVKDEEHTKSKILENERELEEQEVLLKEQRTLLEEISKRIEGKSRDIKSKESEIEVISEDLKKKTASFNLGQTTYLREQSRLESMENITERYEGYSNSIRKVMEQKSKEPGIIGVVADIIKVNKDYEVAIETALGGSVQNIVTSNAEVAKKMISFLKTNKFGRATFLPLSTIKANSDLRKSPALKEEGAVGIASDLAIADEKFKELCDYLLGRTLVVKNIDNGIAIAKKYRQSIRIVTLEGELINPGGTMTGGAFKNSSHLLSRRREIEEAKKSVVLLKKELDELGTAVANLKKEKAEKFAYVDAKNLELKEDFVEQNTSKMNAEAIAARVLRLKERQHENRELLTGLSSQLNDIVLNQESIQVELDTSKALETELNDRIKESAKELKEAQNKELEKQKELENMHLEYASTIKELNFNVENVTRIEEEEKRYRSELLKLTKNRDGVGEEIKTKEHKILDLEKTIEESKDLFDEIRREIEEQKSLRESLTKKNKRFMEDRDNLSTRLSDIDKDIYRQESRLTGLAESGDKLISYMWDEYEITYNAAKELKDDNLSDLSVIRKSISQLKSDIKSLGDVNVNAIEDYKNVSERYEFLKTQHDDLIEAEKTLVQIIDELDKAMRKQFNEQFEKIAKEFDTVFKQLFGGGKGTLELMEDEDILEAGIKIIAQPPGKKLQNMMQLSGGEKALTAIALLFAIQNLKPSPFCLLDEIEAALDDSNVGRFAGYLQKLSKYTQFIVITHRRGTMTAADRLYGITMQEKGVSKLVSVSLLEDDLEE